ncbi:MAG TPA: hypothetical protein VMA35_14810 [Candidatus Sulfopaludibacter sp.]|nr:hypothetical protein [Candidatus Sulfopaludibacter sp.]
MIPTADIIQPRPGPQAGLVSKFGWLMLGAALTVHAGGFEADNVYWGSPVLPADLKRVLVLPLACDSSFSDLPEGCTALQPTLLAELAKTEKFEVIPADPGTLRRLTGRIAWTGAEILPADFFESLQAAYGCDAVLFCQLTVYRTYPPLEIGWRMKLVDAHARRALWSVDDVFNAPKPPPAPKAFGVGLDWFGLETVQASPGWLGANSPRQFGQATLVSVVNTLPYRQEMPKVSAPSADLKSGQLRKLSGLPMKNERHEN